MASSLATVYSRFFGAQFTVPFLSHQLEGTADHEYQSFLGLPGTKLPIGAVYQGLIS